jgi:glycosyltransferase involved in cell wall biosynthesis
VKYAIDGIINFSQVPLSIVSGFGTFMTVCSIVGLLFIIVRRLLFGDPVAGWASTICVVLFLGGLQIFCLGIIGQYTAKTYLETKQRPHYIVAETNRDDTIKIK